MNIIKEQKEKKRGRETNETENGRKGKDEHDEDVSVEKNTEARNGSKRKSTEKKVNEMKRKRESGHNTEKENTSSKNGRRAIKHEMMIGDANHTESSPDTEDSDKHNGNEAMISTVRVTHGALKQAVYTKNVRFLINFTYLDEQFKIGELTDLSRQCKVDLLLFLFSTVKKGIVVELLDLVVLLLRSSRELLYDRTYKGVVQDVVKYLKEYSLEYNKVVYLKGRLRCLKRDRRGKERAMVEQNENELG